MVGVLATLESHTKRNDSQNVYAFLTGMRVALAQIERNERELRRASNDIEQQQHQYAALEARFQTLQEEKDTCK